MASGRPGWVIGLHSTEALIWFANGDVASLERSDGPADVAVGHLVLVEGFEFDHAPKAITEALIATGRVREVASGNVVLTSTRFGTIRVPENTVTVNSGDDVEFVPGCGITRVLAPPVDDIGSEFLIPPGTYSETFADIVGREDDIDLMRATIEAVLDDSDTSANHGVLFTGPPGTGKTMFAKALANEAGVKAFFHLRGPEITSKWVNESEERLRQLFDEARTRHESAIIFVDEIDSMAGRRSDSDHTRDNKFVGQFLSLMSQVADSGRVLVIGATNQAHLLDSALRRQGRFALNIAFNLPDEVTRFGILRNAAPPDIATNTGLLLHLAENTDEWNGADLSGIWDQAKLWSRKDKRTTITIEDVLLAHHRVLGSRVAPNSQGATQ